MLCSKCGHSNGNEARFCESCGLPLAGGGVSDTAQMGREVYYKAFIGPKNQEYYLRHFARFDAAGKAGIGWNWPAALLNFFWFIHRRMWLIAFGYIISMNILAVIFGVILGEAAKPLMLVVQVALPGLFANAIYYRRCKQAIAQVEAADGMPQQQLDALATKGGCGKAGTVAVIVLFVVFIIGVLAAIAIPQYQQYVMRSRVVGAEALGRKAVDAADAYRRQQGKLPATLADAGFAETLPDFVYAVEMDGDAVVVTIRQGSDFPDGGSLSFAPPAVEGQPRWTCSARRLAAEILPPGCQ